MSLVLDEPRFHKCVLSLNYYGITFMKQLHDRYGVAFSWKTFKRWKRLDSCGPVPVWFDISVWFLGSVVLSSGCSLPVSDHTSPDICFSRNFDMVCDNLLDIDTAVRLSVYTDGSLSGLDTVGMKAGAAVFFEDIDSELGVKIAASSSWWLPYRVGERFLRAGNSAISSNSRHFVCDIFWSIHWVHWELLSTCASNYVVGVALCKGFVFDNWYCKSVSVFKDPRVAACNMVSFVCEFCAVFRDEIWLIHARHRAVMEKGRLIPHDGSISASVSGFSMGLSADVVRLLGIANAISIHFGFRRSCLFFSGACEEVSVHISA
ncbi:hypothetical protein G9A89_021182 [Geosiphon pyriformis]|nr:hypothetical protein G9A89_021182 [Geosiphon pyriformis]